jgi:dimethylhistidine N-methyltransferase
VLLDALRPAVYFPIDISSDFLSLSADLLAAVYPEIQVVPLVGDFTGPIVLPYEIDGPFTGFFPGSTIGNFAPHAAIDLLRSFRTALGSGAALVIGIDTRKNPRLLEAAYDDAAGVTAAFNLNLLHRINRELDGSIDVSAFEHRALWHDRLGRIEMHLVAIKPTEMHVAGRHFVMQAGETIHTENSYKYTLEESALLARASGWEPAAMWTDPDVMFGLHVWRAAPEHMEP